MLSCMNSEESTTRHLVALDHEHLWHPFTPMRQWREQTPLIIERGEGFELIDTEGQHYIDGVSSLWCNVHGHVVSELDDALREQLDKIAHTTLLGLSSPPAIELAALLCQYAPGGEKSSCPLPEDLKQHQLNKVFYSDAGATAVEVAFKMAVGYWFHQGQPQKCKFIGLGGAYHGDTTGAMSVGYSELFHKPFVSMVFDVESFQSPDSARPPQGVKLALETKGMQMCSTCQGHGHCGLDVWPNECLTFGAALTEVCLADLERLLQKQAGETAAIVIEPVMQGAAGMVAQPRGFVRGVAELATKYDTLLIADEVAVGFGRTGRMFACEHDKVVPDLLCLAKGISAGYLPLAATMCTDKIESAFTGELLEKKTFYHGHTYTGNPLACAVAIASLQRFESHSLMDHIQQSARLISDKLDALRPCQQVLEVRQRGLMVGIELCRDRSKNAEPFDFSKRMGYALCDAMRDKGLIVRPLGDVLVLMPAPAMDHDTLSRMLNIVVETILEWSWN